MIDVAIIINCLYC